MSCWREFKLKNFINVNPRENLIKGAIAKKIQMDNLLPLCRDIKKYEIAKYFGGSKFRNEDTVMARITPCLENGKRAKVSILEEGEIGFGSTEYIVFRAKKGISDANFIYYLVCSDLIREPAIKSMVGSSGRQRVQTDVIENLQLLLPPLPVQKKIAAILLSLDDKIELNNKINENLEQQAQAIFKSWFVDFEPFGGEMPDDWKEGDVYSIADITYGASFSSKLFNKEKKGLPVIRIRDLKRQYSNTYTEEIHLRAYTIKAGDIVVGMDGEFRPYIWGGDNGLLNQRVCVFHSKRCLGKLFLYFAIRPLLNKVEQTEVATTVIHIGKQDFDAFKIILPTCHILDKFDDITDPIYNKIVGNLLENRRLSQLRDTLLPKLMSGEIDVSKVNIDDFKNKTFGGKSD